MSLLSWIADRLILCPSTQPIDAQAKRREWIPTEFGRIEAWVGRFPNDDEPELDLTILKFPGTGGRAERAGVHPAEIWGLRSEVWTINPHGYGGSTGPASMKKFPAMILAVANHLQRNGGGRPVVVIGNSLGCVSALRFAEQFEPAGLILRNPPPVRNMIRTRPRYSAWNFGMSKVIADQVPVELDTIANAVGCTQPCLLIQSAEDQVVPVEYQDRIFNAYHGPIEKFVIEGADHHELVDEIQQQDYVEAIRRFKMKLPVCRRS